MSQQQQPKSQICPWCQTEIVWDEEIGPETVCPHCYNELTDYRTVTVQRDASIVFEEDPNDEWNRYTRTAERYLDAQEEAIECPHCQEYMVFAGEQIITDAVFAPRPALPDLPPFLTAPFRVETYICSYCFAVHQRLPHREKRALIERLAVENEDEEK